MIEDQPLISRSMIKSIRYAAIIVASTSSPTTAARDQRLHRRSSTRIFAHRLRHQQMRIEFSPNSSTLRSASSTPLAISRSLPTVHRVTPAMCSRMAKPVVDVFRRLMCSPVRCRPLGGFESSARSPCGSTTTQIAAPMRQPQATEGDPSRCRDECACLPLNYINTRTTPSRSAHSAKAEGHIPKIGRREAELSRALQWRRHEEELQPIYSMTEDGISAVASNTLMLSESAMLRRSGRAVIALLSGLCG